MRFSSILAGLGLAASATLAAPSRSFAVAERSIDRLDTRVPDNPANHSHPIQEHSAPEVRSPGGAGRAELGADVVKAVYAIVHMVQDRMQKDKDDESFWVSESVKQLLQANPTKNVLIFHDQRTKTKLEGSTHIHHEVSIGFGRTKGYEILLFDKGWFELYGDGGWLNVGYGGCWKGGNQHADFGLRTKCPFK